MMSMKISASLASAPTDRLGAALDSLVSAGVDMIHFDVEDGSFVPVMTLGTKIVSDLRQHTSLPFDVHLMMQNPEWIIPELVRSGADRIAIHYEACPYPRRSLGLVHEQGVRAGLAFNPATPVPDLAYLAPFLSFVTILTSEPEGSNPSFLPDVIRKISGARRDSFNESLDWVVDGGISADNIRLAAEAGATTAVVGRGLFANGEFGENLHAIRKALEDDP
jgi:ribulose-phosphate 3-epimerase